MDEPFCTVQVVTRGEPCVQAAQRATPHRVHLGHGLCGGCFSPRPRTHLLRTQPFVGGREVSELVAATTARCSSIFCSLLPAFASPPLAAVAVFVFVVFVVVVVVVVASSADGAAFSVGSFVQGAQARVAQRVRQVRAGRAGQRRRGLRRRRGGLAGDGPPDGVQPRAGALGAKRGSVEKEDLQGHWDLHERPRSADAGGRELDRGDELAEARGEAAEAAAPVHGLGDAGHFKRRPPPASTSRATGSAWSQPHGEKQPREPSTPHRRRSAAGARDAGGAVDGS
mmetsp:Transcript_4650/g.8820  ORF Transcript_4650/g.8820 Transcript_4650/m.8820 type:complete len:283 (+) Transcript_4650:140-988(+)